jgi:tetratricopeptide (TPR) repeat protein
MKRIVALFFSFWIMQTTFAQSGNVDSLRQQLDKTTTDTARLSTIARLAYYYQDSRPDSLLFYSKQLLEEANRFKNQRMVSIAYSSIGQYEYISGNYSLALQWLFKSLQLAENINDSNRIANTHNLIGNTYKEYGDYKRAIPHYEECKKIAELSNDLRLNGLFSCLNLGEVYALMGISDSALLYSQQAYSLAVKYQSKWIGSALMALGYVEFLLNNKDLSLEYFRQGLHSYYGHWGNSRYLSIGYLAMAGIFKKYGQTDSAIYFARVALDVAGKVPYLKGVGAAGKFLSAIYDSLHIADSAFVYQKLFLSINDSLNDHARITNFENQIFLEQVRQREKEQAQAKLKEDRKQNIQYAFIVVGIITFVILFLLLSHSIIVNEKIISFFGVLGLLVVFEFINLLIHPSLAAYTHESPVLMLLALVIIASLLIPLHHRLEKWIKEKMTKKNTRIRLEAARKTIQKLEKRS